MINALSCISRLVVNDSDMLITNTSIHSFLELSALEKHSRAGGKFLEAYEFLLSPNNVEF